MDVVNLAGTRERAIDNDIDRCAEMIGAKAVTISEQLARFRRAPRRHPCRNRIGGMKPQQVLNIRRKLTALRNKFTEGLKHRHGQFRVRRVRRYSPSSLQRIYWHKQ